MDMFNIAGCELEIFLNYGLVISDSLFAMQDYATQKRPGIVQYKWPTQLNTCISNLVLTHLALPKQG